MKRTKVKCEKCEKLISLSNRKRHYRSCVLGEQTAWNAGLTKEQDERVAQYSRTLKTLMNQKVQNGTYQSIVLSDEAKERLSLRMSKRNPGGKSKWFKVNGISVQGTWERNLAEHMTYLKIDWCRHSPIKYVKDGQIKRYSPDFFLKEVNVAIEVKGYWWGTDKLKMRLVLEQNQNSNILVVEKQFYKRLISTTSKEEFLSLVS